MYYAFEAYQVNQWRSVDEIDCGPLEEEDCIFKDGEDVLDYYSQDEEGSIFFKKCLEPAVNSLSLSFYRTIFPSTCSC